MTPHPSLQAGQPPGNDLSALNGPGIGLLVSAGSGMLAGLLQLTTGLISLVGGSRSAAFDDPNLPPALKSYLEAASSGGISLVMALVMFAVNALILFGGIKMRQGQSYALCVAASALCSVPCCFHSLCCVWTMPLGIWALVTLLAPPGRARFSS